MTKIKMLFAVGIGLLTMKLQAQDFYELRSKQNNIVYSVDSSSEIVGALLDASSINRGTLPDARLDSSSVTLVGNVFNGASQLVELTSGGLLPALNASNLTNVSVSAVSGILSVVNGGTGLSSVPAGDLLYGNGTGNLVLLPAGSANEVLAIVNSSPTWIVDPGVSAILNSTNTFTGQNTFNNLVNISSSIANGNVSAITLSGANASVIGNLSIGGIASGNGSGLTNVVAADLSGGVGQEIPYQTAANVTSFISSPTVANTSLQWNGSSLVWGTFGTGTGTTMGSGVANEVAYWISGSTLSASSNLTFNGSNLTVGGSQLVVNGGNVGISSAAPAGLFVVGNGTVTALDNGDVGIDKQNPSYPLDVNGAINASSLLVNGVPVSAGNLLNSNNTWTGQQTFDAQVVIDSEPLLLNGNSQGTEFIQSSSTNGPVYINIYDQDIQNNKVVALTLSTSPVGGNNSAPFGLFGYNATGIPDGYAQPEASYQLSQSAINNYSPAVNILYSGQVFVKATNMVVNSSELIDGFEGSTTTVPDAILEVSSPTIGGSSAFLLSVDTGSLAGQQMLVVEANGDVGINQSAPQYSLDVNSPALQPVRINGLLMYGSVTNTQLQSLSCPAIPCQANSSTDWDIYTATGTGVGQWRNERLGIGPQ